MTAQLDGRSRVPAVERVVLVLEALSGSADGLAFGDLAARVPIARSSLHDLCSSLVDSGLLERTAAGRYAIGLKVVELARRRLNSMQLVSTFREVFEATSGPPETMVLAVLSGADVVYMAFVDGARPLAVKYEIGMRLPAAFTASGKAILSTMPPDRVRALLPAQLSNPHGIHGDKALSDLVRELELTRAQGYSIDDEETAAGMTCIGAPVFAADSGQAIGAVAVSLVKSAQDWFDSRVSEYVRGVATEISRRLGASVPPR